MKKSKRILIAKDTLRLLKSGFYKNDKGVDIGLSRPQKSLVSNTVLYTPEKLDILIDTIKTEGTLSESVYVVNDKTTLDAVRDEIQYGKKLVCLNFASARNPGGGFLTGSQAQEESIARASGLYPSLLKAEKYYQVNRAYKSCLYTNHIIYSPDVPIFKYEDGEFMDEIICASVITAPAVNAGVVLRNETEKEAEIIPTMRKRMDMILAICLEQGYETLVLGAWGCGVFQNDPQMVAKLFHELLEGKYQNCFSKVIFAIYSKDERFIEAFKNYF